MDEEITRDLAERALQMTMNARQVAERLGVTRMAVSHWEREGKLNRMQSVGGTAIFWEPDVADFEARRKTQAFVLEPGAEDPFVHATTALQMTEFKVTSGP